MLLLLVELNKCITQYTCSKTTAILDIVYIVVKYVWYVKPNSAVTCPEAFTGTKWCQLVSTAPMKAFLSILHICSDTIIVLMQQQQVCRLPFALLWNHHHVTDSSFFSCICSLQASIYDCLKTLHVAEIVTLYNEQNTCMLSNHACTSQQVVLVLQMPDRSGSCLIWACYQQHRGCSCPLIRKGKQNSSVS